MKKLVIALTLLTIASVSQARTFCFDNDGVLAKIQFDEESVRINWNVKEKNTPQNIETGGITQFTKNGSHVSLQATFSGMSDVYNQRISIGEKQISFQALWTNGTAADEPVVYRQLNCQ